jgi:NAD(P)-dependent dehydrogenase (short-subunit alcohol dehydrogenase family)
MARRFVADGAERVVVADLNAAAARQVADEIGADAITVDVADREAMNALVASVLESAGRIDLFCSNAGIAPGFRDPNAGGIDASVASWELGWDVNVMAHVHAARAALPSMVARGKGYLLQTVSAAGLLTSPSDAVYAVTKHAAIGFAEWLAVQYGGQGSV